MANGEAWRKYPRANDPSKQVIKAAASGNSDLLSKLLQQMNPQGAHTNYVTVCILNL